MIWPGVSDLFHAIEREGDPRRLAAPGRPAAGRASQRPMAAPRVVCPGHSSAGAAQAPPVVWTR
jgi:hypothetical protein